MGDVIRFTSCASAPLFFFFFFFFFFLSRPFHSMNGSSILIRAGSRGTFSHAIDVNKKVKKKRRKKEKKEQKKRD